MRRPTSINLEGGHRKTSRDVLSFEIEGAGKKLSQEHNNERSIIRTRAFSAIVATLVLAFSAASVHAQQRIRVGALYPLSGQVAKSGEDTLNAIRLAVDIINNKTPGISLPFVATEGLPNLGGAKIEIVAADHQGSPEIRQAEAERLIEHQKRAAVIDA